MSILFQSIVQEADGSWTFVWSNDGSAFWRIVLWGIELDRVTSPTYNWSGLEYHDFSPPLEIAKQASLVLSEQFQPYLIVQWYGILAAQSYLIQQTFDNISWSTIETFQEVGQWVYSYQTVTLTDEFTYTYRVIAVDQYGNLSSPEQYIKYVTCPPTPPDAKIQISYTTPDVVISRS